MQPLPNKKRAGFFQRKRYAYIYIENEEDGPYYTLMIAMEADEIFISRSSYTNAYCKYLFSSTLAAVLPPTVDTTYMMEI